MPSAQLVRAVPIDRIARHDLGKFWFGRVNFDARRIGGIHFRFDPIRMTFRPSIPLRSFRKSRFFRQAIDESITPVRCAFIKLRRMHSIVTIVEVSQTVSLLWFVSALPTRKNCRSIRNYVNFEFRMIPKMPLSRTIVRYSNFRSSHFFARLRIGRKSLNGNVLSSYCETAGHRADRNAVRSAEIAVKR